MLLKKKISSFTFLAITALPYLLFSFFLMKQQYIKWEKRKELQKKPLETIVIAAADVVWFEKGKEIILNNRLFDVASIRQEGESLVIKGIYDGDETHLLKKMHGLSRKQQRKTQESQTFLAWLLTGFHESEAPSALTLDSDKLNHQEKPTLSVCTTFLPIHSPPPQTC